MQLNRNTALRPSGDDWVGNIPQHWSLRRLKYLATANDDVISESTPPDTEILYVDIGSVDPTDGIIWKEPMMFEDAPSRARRLVKDGDTIVSTVRTYLKAIAAIRQPEPNLVVSTGFAVIRPRSIDPVFLSYCLRSHYFIERVVSLSAGVSYPATNASDVTTIPIPLPEPSEQRSIAEFLERETRTIDSLIAKKRTLIDKLKEKRTALISQTVTHGLPPDDARAAGLNPEPRMKESGIEWLGEIPEHWNLKRLKYGAVVIMGQSPSSDSYSTDISDRPFLQGNAEFGEKFPVARWYCEQAAKVAPKGSILISVRAPVGALNEADQEYGIGRGLCAISCRCEILDKDFAWYALHLARVQLDATATGSTYDAVSVGDVGDTIMSLPPIPEQVAIANFLSEKTLLIDQLIKKVNQAIMSLQFLRNSLISAATTGKIDLRGLS